MITSYLLRLLPGVALIGLFLGLLPRAALEIRMMTYIFLFILFRDAMTPEGFWHITPPGIIRFAPEPAILSLLAALSLAFVGAIQWLDPPMRELVVWFKGRRAAGIAVGVMAALLISVPVAFGLWLMHPPKADMVPRSLLPYILALTLIGNLLEETLFRGYFQGYMEQRVTPLKAALLSGVLFCMCHSFLALTVTNIGAMLLLFTLYEGIVAGLVRMWFGVVPSSLAHGGAVFLLASGLLI